MCSLISNYNVTLSVVFYSKHKQKQLFEDTAIGARMHISFTLFNEFKATGDYCSPSSLVAEINKSKIKKDIW